MLNRTLLSISRLWLYRLLLLLGAILCMIKLQQEMVWKTMRPAKRSCLKSTKRNMVLSRCLWSKLKISYFSCSFLGDKVPHNRSLTPQTPNHCKKLPCRGGCICPSLNSDKETAKHCDHPECMLHYNCILPKEIASRPKVIPSIIHPDDKFYQKNDSSSTEADSPPAKRAVANKLRPRGIPAARKNAQKKVPAKSSVKSAGLPRGVKRPLVVLPSVDDHKLKQECFVKIIR